MDNRIKRVKEFHEGFSHPINTIGTEDKKTRQLRIKLLFEEVQELAEASDVKETWYELCRNNSCNAEDLDGDNVNYKEELDAILDVDYVLNGKILTGGYQDVFDEASIEVHNSNMSKMCNSESEVRDTIAHYNDKGVKSYSVKKGNSWIVLRLEDNKVLKNLYYKEASLSKYVQ